MLLQQQQLMMMSRGLESSHGDVTGVDDSVLALHKGFTGSTHGGGCGQPLDTSFQSHHLQGGGGGLRSGSGSSCHLTLEYQMDGLTVTQMAASSTKRCQKMLPPTLPLWTLEFLLPISQLNINPPLVSLGHFRCLEHGNMNSHN
ncbi:hypothetical protein SAY86_018706 [Trapa natans]|uniref:Uncharacterized protein n=1 Tax=Trapa natans TaxID=22666 RepID=A0AAN7R3D9_TRANT|nr:hypothetical protein SAY86_018706 [Trapa natans]